MQNRYESPKDIYLFLESQQAPKKLIKHHQLVVEAAEEIIFGLKNSFPDLDCNYKAAKLFTVFNTIFFVYYNLFLA